MTPQGVVGGDSGHISYQGEALAPPCSQASLPLILLAGHLSGCPQSPVPSPTGQPLCPPAQLAPWSACNHAPIEGGGQQQVQAKQLHTHYISTPIINRLPTNTDANTCYGDFEACLYYYRGLTLTVHFRVSRMSSRSSLVTVSMVMVV